MIAVKMIRGLPRPWTWREDFAFVWSGPVFWTHEEWVRLAGFLDCAEHGMKIEELRKDVEYHGLDDHWYWSLNTLSFLGLLHVIERDFVPTHVIPVGVDMCMHTPGLVIGLDSGGIFPAASAKRNILSALRWVNGFDKVCGEPWWEQHLLYPDSLRFTGQVQCVRKVPEYLRAADPGAKNALRRKRKGAS